MSSGRLLSDYWYRYQQVLVAAAAAEALNAGSAAGFDLHWSSLLFKGALGLGRAEKADKQQLLIDPLSFPIPVRSRLFRLACATGPNLWGEAAPFFTPKTAGHHRAARPRAAKLIAGLFHDNITPAHTIWRIAKQELPDLQALPDQGYLVDAVGELAAALRRGAARREKLRAITAFGARVPMLVAKWRALELALVQPLLDWIPVVVGDPQQERDRPGVMMPVIMDVEQGAPHTSQNGDEAYIEIVGLVGRPSQELRYSANHGREAAVQLWQMRHKYYPETARLRVENAKVVVDFQLVTGIALGLAAPRTNISSHIDLTGSSLELPVALGIYERLAGLRRSAEIRSSGGIGNFRIDDQGGADSAIRPVGGIVGKALAADAQLADRIIVPPGPAPVQRDGLILHAATLGAAVDYAFGDADGHRFIRAADIAASCKTSPYSPYEKRRIRDDLVRHGGVIVELAEPPGLVAAALMSVNVAISKEGGYRSNGRYTFVRLSGTERADAAWATIWSAVDGDLADLDAFIWAGSDEERAEIFARQLSRRRPSLVDPRLSPHVLVVVGIGPPLRPVGLPGGLQARFSVRRIMKKVDRFLGDRDSPADPRLRRRIGSTRVVLVQSDGLTAEDAELPAGVDADIRRAVEQLSPFRFGFTFAMACRQLVDTQGKAVDAQYCEQLLTEMRRVSLADGSPLLVVGCTNTHRLRAAPIAFEFMLRARLLPPSPSLRLDLHERAALAIAPFLRPGSRGSHVEISTGYSAPWLDEALAQVNLARASGRGAHIPRERALNLKADRIRLLRISGTPILERLPLLCGRHGDAASYLDYVERLQPRHHPAMHVRAAAMATTLAGDPDAEPALRKSFEDAAVQHLLQADEAIRWVPTEEERRGCAFLIGTERCRIAWSSRGFPLEERPLREHLQSLFERTRFHLRYMREIYWGDWFEHAGDFELDERRAREIYAAGLEKASHSGTFASARLLAKWVGTFAPIEVIAPADLSFLKRQADAGFWRYIRSDKAERDAALRRATADRWLRGIARIGRISGGSGRPQARRQQGGGPNGPPPAARKAGTPSSLSEGMVAPKVQDPDASRAA